MGESFVSDSKNSIIEYIKKHSAIESFTSVVAIAWGVSLLINKDMFLEPIFELLYDRGSATLWGVVSILIGLFQYVGMITRHFYIRTISTLAATGFWIMIGVMFLISPVPNNTGVTYLLIGIMTIILYIEIEVGGKE